MWLSLKTSTECFLSGLVVLLLLAALCGAVLAALALPRLAAAGAGRQGPVGGGGLGTQRRGREEDEVVVEEVMGGRGRPQRSLTP